MTVVIIARGFANGVPCPHAGQYLESFDFEANDGVGYGEFTTDRRRAMEFPDKVKAWEFWNTIPKCKPRRDDGRANKPLTAVSVELFESNDFRKL
jgi:hypothetical protein